MDDNTELYEKVVKFSDFLEMFGSNFDRLLWRYKKYEQISDANFEEKLAYFDLLIVQLRALCIENERYKNNYTVQILMRKLGKEDLADRMDKYLMNDVIEGISIREAIKFIADKFICHLDNTTKDDRVQEHVCRSYLSNPHFQFNLTNILKEITEIIGLSI